ncbi:putative protein OS=Eoetvoesiella caeni OX=645616 GN=DFR37_110124 PE=4 SV=1 [Eoetvoesiella caeni]|uniref:Uncharacterized protein n=1 Tax=Eoetvoesiella caeni TaxID=645616 RepID=A0A366H5J3_9BURK|nr:hypothetical protein DFR37_110124 [Eoetvoesiella caeni]
MMREVGDCWVVHSPNESAVNDGAGFWPNGLGPVRSGDALFDRRDSKLAVAGLDWP